MSHGLLVENDLGRRVIDENTPIYHVGECHKVTMSKWTFNAYADYYYGVVDMYYYHKKAYTGSLPPMVFIKTREAHNGVWDFMNEWYHNLRVKYYGSHNNWTVTLVRVLVNLGRGTAFPSWWSTWDPRREFIVVGSGTSAASGEFGAFVFDANGRMVFNSNDNFFKFTQYSNNWTLIYDQEEIEVTRALANGTSGSYGKRHHIWASDIAPLSGDWVLVNPTQEFRRYNGEVGFSWNYRILKNFTIYRGLQTGNSGTPVHWPIIIGRPNLPLKSEINSDGSLRWCFT